MALTEAQEKLDGMLFGRLYAAEDVLDARTILSGWPSDVVTVADKLALCRDMVRCSKPAYRAEWKRYAAHYARLAKGASNA